MAAVLLAVSGLLPLQVRAQNGDPELQRLVATLLPRVEELSGLEARRALNVARRTREELRTFIGREVEKQIADGQMAHAERAYRLLGLLPDSTDLGALSAAMLGDAIQGYYNPATDTLYVLEDVSALELKPVLAHEMVHALQDQHYSLDSLRARAPGNDRFMAARAAIEGHATLVMFWILFDELKGSPVTLAELPDFARLPLEALMPGAPSPAYASAPRVMRESGAFPYGRGAGFAHALRVRNPGAVPFDSLFPVSTEQVMQPERRFLDARDEPTTVRFAAAQEGDSAWRVLHENTLGQFELSILLMERHRLQSESVAEGWDGDRYRLLTDGQRHALVWSIVWDDARAASRFVSVYRQILRTRLGRSADVEQIEIDGRPVVRIIEAEEGVDLASVPRLAVHLEEAGPPNPRNE